MVPPSSNEMKIYSKAKQALRKTPKLRLKSMIPAQKQAGTQSPADERKRSSFPR